MRALTDVPIDVAALRAAVSAPEHGAVLVFEGVSRADTLDGAPIVALDYEAFPELAVPVLARLADAVEAEHGVRAAIVHRLGRVRVGEASLVIAVGAGHRPAAFEACRALLEAVKRELPVWKKELRADGRGAWRANDPAPIPGRPLGGLPTPTPAPPPPGGAGAASQAQLREVGARHRLLRNQRPTPQRQHFHDAPDRTGERPRFRDRMEPKRDGVNPYIALHRGFDRRLVPAVEAWTWRDRWAERFGRTAPLVLEVGCGNGEFLAALAARERGTDFVGVEIRYKRVVLVARKLEKAGIDNAVICRYHAGFLDDLFAPGTLDGVWMNHPDPWPKERHEKNRLLSRWFLEDVAAMVRPGGFFHLKTDFAGNVARAIQAIGAGPHGPALPFEVTGRADDVTRGPAPWPDDLETNYQSKFRLRGLPVAALALRRTDAPWPPEPAGVG